MTALNIVPATSNKCLQGRVPLPPLLMSQAVLQLTWMTITAHTKEEGISHLLFVLRSGEGFVCMYTVRSYEVSRSSAG